MNIKLIKTKINNLNLFQNKSLEIDFFAEKRVSAEEQDNFLVTNLFNRVYKLNTIAFVGRNASGKTVTLNIVSDILDIYVYNNSLSDIKTLADFFDEELIIQNILTDGKFLYKIDSTIKKDFSGNMFFQEESLSKVKITKDLKRNNLDEAFEGIEEEKRSHVEDAYLKDVDSMFSKVLNRYKKVTPYIRNLSQFTNFNRLSTTLEVPLSFVNYLDPSIELFELIEYEGQITVTAEQKYLIRFKDSSKDIVVNASKLEDYLSSGTIKGINILYNAKTALRTGGYLLIDEIENHLNKSIVINLIDLFTSEMNKKGATLIFTTHYSEILDSITRSDNIYVLEKKENILIEKFSKEAGKKDRLDKKKSDLILSGQVGSSPSYKSYMNLKKDLQDEIEKEGV